MTYIKQTEIINPSYVVAARCYHQAKGDRRIQVVRMYTRSEQRDGTGMQEYLLTRYETRLGVPMSALLEVKYSQNVPEGKAFDLTAVRREGRKQEERMILDWYGKAMIGGIDT